MLITINGLRERDRFRVEVAEQTRRMLERRGGSPRAVRVAFFDDDGARGGVAIRCALTVTPARGPGIRVEHTARTYSAAFKGALSVLTRTMKRRVQRQRRRKRYPRPRPAARRLRRAQRAGEDDAEALPPLGLLVTVARVGRA
jgi:hypothetical protein